MKKAKRTQEQIRAEWAAQRASRMREQMAAESAKNLKGCKPLPLRFKRK